MHLWAVYSYLHCLTIKKKDIKQILLRYYYNKKNIFWMAAAALMLVCMIFFTIKMLYRFYILLTDENGVVTETIKDALFVMLSSYILLAGILIFIVKILRKNKQLQESASNHFAEAKNAVEDAKHSKAQFLNTMTNELRLPLNHMLGNMSSLLQTPLSDQQRTQANLINRDGITLLSIINDSLDFFKIESGKLEIESNAFMLRLCIEEVLQILALDSRRIKINYEIDSKIPGYIMADLARIRQVLMNLIGNAMQINDTGKLMLYVELTSEQNEVMMLQFKISDVDERNDSVLLTPETAENIPYVSHYTGLGLSVAARLVALMGGAIKVESTSASGTVFTFTIKVKKITDTKHMNQNPIAPEKVDIELFKKIPLRILAADDNEISQMVLSSILLKMGYNCEVAQNGSEAVNKAIEQEYDLIFMDMFMPEMDGLEATRRIREYYLKSQHPIIIALTSNALEEKETFMKAGINNFITKPFKPKDLEQIIIQSCSN